MCNFIFVRKKNCTFGILHGSQSLFSPVLITDDEGFSITFTFITNNTWKNGNYV